MLRAAAISWSIGGAALASEVLPVAISPARSHGVARVEGPCPTFSWAGVPAADGYELAVFRVVEGELATGTSTIEERPVLVERLPSGARSWTPSGARCLEALQTYAWAIRARAAGEPQGWSTARLFALAAPAPGILEDALATLRAHPGPRSSASAPSTRPQVHRVPAPDSDWAAAAVAAAANVQGASTFAVDGAGNVVATSFSGDGSALTGVLASTAATAGALAADPADCNPGDAPAGIGPDGAAQGCFDVATQAELDLLQPTSMAANGANCSAGSAPLGVNAQGAVEGCFDVATQAELLGYHPTALAADGANCSAGLALHGVTAALAAEDCWDVATQFELNTHKGSGDHDARYVLQSGGAVSANLSWECPTGTSRAGTWCIDDSATAGFYPNAFSFCSAGRRTLCPYEAIATCDLLDLGKTGSSTSCGDYTDSGGAAIWLATPAGDDGDNVENSLAYLPDNSLAYLTGPVTSLAFYCCVPINP